jgi:hypothetical protein
MPERTCTFGEMSRGHFWQFSKLLPKMEKFGEVWRSLEKFREVWRVWKVWRKVVRSQKKTMLTMIMLHHNTASKSKTKTKSLIREKYNEDGLSGRCSRRLIELQCLTRKSLPQYSALRMRRWTNQDLSNGLRLGFRSRLLDCAFLVILTPVKVAWSTSNRTIVCSRTDAAVQSSSASRAPL